MKMPVSMVDIIEVREPTRTLRALGAALALAFGFAAALGAAFFEAVLALEAAEVPVTAYANMSELIVIFIIATLYTFLAESLRLEDVVFLAGAAFFAGAALVLVAAALAGAAFLVDAFAAGVLVVADFAALAEGFSFTTFLASALGAALVVAVFAFVTFEAGLAAGFVAGLEVDLETGFVTLDSGLFWVLR